MSNIRQEHQLFSGNFLLLNKLEYIDRHGRTRFWESADRVGGTARQDNSPSAVLILARIVPDNEILLVRQFRPPAGRPMIEFPAGLIDPGESAADTAVRELYEETGFAGRVLGCSAGGYSSPGMTGESIILAAMEIDGKNYPDGMIPANHQEECENIEVFRVKSDELSAFIKQMEESGCGIDSKIYTVLAFREFGW